MSLPHHLASLTALMVAIAGAAACGSGGAAGARIDASPPVACDVPGGFCAPGQLCAHICDCCGIPLPEDAGLEISGHEECVDDIGQCASGAPFFVGDNPASCWCTGGPGIAECPCA